MNVPYLTRELATVLPRSLDAVRRQPGWSAASARGLRQLGEVLLDELTLSGMTLMNPAPSLTRPLSECVSAAEELTGLGVDGAHRNPNPLQISVLRRQRFAGMAYERVAFAHDPQLPGSLSAAGLGGPATAEVHLCRHSGGPRPWLIWVHGAGQGGTSDLLVSRAGRLQQRLGYNVALPVQPGHGRRRRRWPAYPGNDPLANVAGMMRSISEVRAVLRWLRPQADFIVVAGVSMGSPVAALVSQLEPAAAVALYTPILDLNAMIGLHLWRWGASRHDVAAVLQSEVATALMSVVNPLNVIPMAPPQRRLIVGARYDRMAFPDPALALHQRWGGQLYWHEGGHAGHIVSRGVQARTEQFLREVAS